MRSTDGASEELADEISRLEDRMDAMADIIGGLNEQVERLEQENEELRREQSQLRRQIEEVDDRTDLLQYVRKGTASDQDTKIALILTSLRNEVEKRNAPATIDAKGCWEAIGRTADRTTMYDLMETAAEVVESEAVTYIKEGRSSKRNSRLKMDPDEGVLPSNFAGHDLTQKGEA